MEPSSSSRGTPQEHDNQLSGMEILPRDIALDILSRLSITSLLQFRRVCRAWRALAQDPCLTTMHLDRATEHHPLLILHCDRPLQNQLYYIDTDSIINCYNMAIGKIRSPFESVMPEFDVVGSCNGLLCLSDSLYCDPVYVTNPFTGNYIELPKVKKQYKDQEVVLGFGFDPVTKEYKVMRIVYYGVVYRHRHGSLRYRNSDIQMFTLGRDDAWRSIGPVPKQLERRPSEALVNGNLHWVIRRRILGQLPNYRAIVSFSLADEEFRELPRLASGNLDHCDYHLVVLGGCLSAAVYRDGGGIEIWVLKDYSVKESWIKEFVIGEYVPVGLNDQDVSGSPPWTRKEELNEAVKVICLLKNGKIILEYKSKALVAYDPEKEVFEDLAVHRIPNWFKTVIHMGSLVPIIRRS